MLTGFIFPETFFQVQMIDSGALQNTVGSAITMFMPIVSIVIALFLAYFLYTKVIGISNEGSSTFVTPDVGFWDNYFDGPTKHHLTSSMTVPMFDSNRKQIGTKILTSNQRGGKGKKMWDREFEKFERRNAIDRRNERARNRPNLKEMTITSAEEMQWGS